MDIRSNLMYGNVAVNEAYTAKANAAAAKESRLATGKKLSAISSDAASLQIKSKTGDRLRALLLYIKTIMMPDVDTLGVNKLHCFENIIRIYTELGNTEMADLFRQRYEECRQENDKIVNR